MIYLESLLPYKAKKPIQLNGERTLEFSVINHEMNEFFFAQLKEESRIIFEDETFVVKNIQSTSRGNKTIEKHVTCVHKFYDDMINNVKYKVHTGSITFNDFMDFVFGDTNYNDYQIDGFFRAKNIENLGRDNRISMFNRGITHYEVEFDLEKIGNNDVRLVVAEQIGDKTDIQFRYGHNVETITVEVDTKDLSTYIKGYGAPGIEAEYTSPNVAAFGKLDSPIVDDERFKTKATLLDEIKKRIIDEPRVFIEITVDEFEKHTNKLTDKPLKVGDSISLIYEPLDDLNVFVRVVKVEPTYNSELEVVTNVLTITNNFDSFLGSYLNEVSKQIEDATKGFQQNINMARNERDLQIKNNYIEVLTLPVFVTEATNTAAHMTLTGEGTTQKLLDGYFTLNGEKLEAPVKQVLFQGFNTISVNFVLTQLQEGHHNLKFYLKSEGNTFSIKQNHCTVFTVGQGLYAQLSTSLPSAYFAEEVKFIKPLRVTDKAFARTQYPNSTSIGERVVFADDLDVIDLAKPAIINKGSLTPEMLSNDKPSPFYIYADTSDAEHHAYLAMDKYIHSYWQSTSDNSRITIDLGSAKVADYHTLVMEDTNISWTLVGSNNEVDWDVLDENEYEFTEKEEVQFTIDEPGSYRYYRWRFNNEEQLRVYEMDLLSEVLLIDEQD